MATLTSSTTVTVAVATTAAAKNPLKNKPSQLSLSRPTQTRRLTRKISCKAASNDDPQEPSQAQNPANNKLDRRNMLIGLGGLYGAAATTLGGTADTLAAPAVLDFSQCIMSDALERCCLPGYDKYKQDAIPAFNFKNYPSPALKVRPAAQLAATDEKYLAKFREALSRMKALPNNDPRSFNNQAQVHCAYCDGAFYQKGHEKEKITFQVHFSWLFLPFHRAYLYFFERILGKLINDPTFAIPYWNWDHPDGMYLPSIYTTGGVRNPLYNENRNPRHLPPKLVNLWGAESNRPVKDPIDDNIFLMNNQVVKQLDATQFMGNIYDDGDQVNREQGPGAIETAPHNAVHGWCGHPGKNNRDMGLFYSAGKDPLFYAHHANIDRMWSIWNTLPGKDGKPRANHTNADFLNTYFIFFDENSKPVKIYVKDVLDTKKLGYSYQDRPLPWLNPPKPAAGGRAQRRAAAPPKKPAEEVKLPRELGQGFTIKVAKKSKTKTDKKDEVLEVRLKLAETNEFVKFDVYLNDEHDHSTEGQPKATVSFAGSFSSLPHVKHGGHVKKMRLALPVTEVIEDIGAGEDEYVNVVFVPRSGEKAVTITGVKIKYQ